MGLCSEEGRAEREERVWVRPEWRKGEVGEEGGGGGRERERRKRGGSVGGRGVGRGGGGRAGGAGSVRGARRALVPALAFRTVPQTLLVLVVLAPRPRTVLPPPLLPPSSLPPGSGRRRSGNRCRAGGGGGLLPNLRPLRLFPLLALRHVQFGLRRPQCGVDRVHLFAADLKGHQGVLGLVLLYMTRKGWEEEGGRSALGEEDVAG